MVVWYGYGDGDGDGDGNAINAPPLFAGSFLLLFSPRGGIKLALA